MKNRYLHLVAMFLAVLVVSLPIYSSVVFASLSNGIVYGGDGVKGYYRNNDLIKINVTASISDDSDGISTSQIKVEGEEFTNCNLIWNGAYVCTHSVNAGELTDNIFVVRLDNDNGEKDSELTIHGSFDEVKPEVELFEITPFLVGEDENIIIRYNVRDISNSDNLNKCTGIKKLVFSHGSYSYTPEINSMPYASGSSEIDFLNDCDKEGSVIVAASDISEASGEIEVTLVAYDNFNQQSDAGRTSFVYDKDAPTVEGFEIMNIYGGVIDYFGANIISDVAVIFEVIDGNLDVDNVFADVSGINIDRPYSYYDKQASCGEGSDGRFNCNITGLRLKLSSDVSSVEINVSVSDLLGNSQYVSLSKAISYDDTGSGVDRIKTNYKHPTENIYYLGGTDNTIILEINSPNAGFYNRNVFLDLRNINNNPNVRADECRVEGGLWKCYWNDVDVTRVNRGVWEVSVEANSVDDLGNSLSGDLEWNLTVDKQDPVIGEISYSPAAPVSGDTIRFIFNVEDDSAVTARINSSLISTTEEFFGSCNQDNECTVEIGDLISSHIDSSVEVIVEDVIGNVASTVVGIVVYQAEGDVVPNFFRVNNAEPIPLRIDRQVASQIPLYVFVHVSLSSVGNGKAISKGVHCEGGNFMDVSLTNEDTNDPYIEIETNPSIGTLQGDILHVNCTLTLKVRDDQFVYSALEIEEINEEVVLYESVFGGVGESAGEKVAKLEGEIAALGRKIENRERTLNTWGTWCSISEMLGQMNVVLQGLKTVLYVMLGTAWSACFGVAAAAAAAASVPCAFTGPGAPACVAAAYAAALLACQKPLEGLWAAKCIVLSDIHAHWIEKFIWPTGFQNPFIIGLMNKASCMIGLHCALCSWDALKNVAVGYVASNAPNSVGLSLPTSEGGEMDFMNFAPNAGRPWYKNEVTASWGGSTITRTQTEYGGWIFDPYKSKDYAYGCLCLPALVYNFKKEQQIKCMYRNCITEHIEKGQPPLGCEAAFAERSCLYVESAQRRKYGYMGGLFGTLWEYVKDNKLVLGTTVAYLFYCWKYIVAPELDCSKALVTGVWAGGYRSTICGAWGSGMTIAEILNMMFNQEFSMNNYEAELGGEDYCETGNY
ncbi:MAG: hypothetical protein U9O94_11720 [Nanoarchaeota archaeon]|nr:hypothetical protein [Nanoarchaeota archaeon]